MGFLGLKPDLFFDDGGVVITTALLETPEKTPRPQILAPSGDAIRAPLLVGSFDRQALDTLAPKLFVFSVTTDSAPSRVVTFTPLPLATERLTPGLFQPTTPSAELAVKRLAGISDTTVQIPLPQIFKGSGENPNPNAPVSEILFSALLQSFPELLAPRILQGSGGIVPPPTPTPEPPPPRVAPTTSGGGGSGGALIDPCDPGEYCDPDDNTSICDDELPEYDPFLPPEIRQDSTPKKRRPPACDAPFVAARKTDWGIGPKRTAVRLATPQPLPRVLPNTLPFKPWWQDPKKLGNLVTLYRLWQWIAK